MKTVKPSLFLSIALFGFLASGFAQRSSKGVINGIGKWHEGSVMMNDGTELVGVVRYNDDTGVLSFENGNTSKSLTAKSVAGFEFFDDAQNKQRVFYVFSYADPLTDIVGPLFFEVVKEFKTFAVLSKVDPLQVKEKSNTTPGTTTPNGGYMPGYSFTTTEISQVETIYVMDPDGRIMPFIKITEKDIDDRWFDRMRVRNKYVDEGLLETYTGPHYGALLKFADENKLNFKRKADLIRILEHYQELIAN